MSALIKLFISLLSRGVTITDRGLNVVDYGIGTIENLAKVGHQMSEDYLADAQFEREMKLIEQRAQRQQRIASNPTAAITMQ